MENQVQISETKEKEFEKKKGKTTSKEKKLLHDTIIDFKDAKYQDEKAVKTFEQSAEYKKWKADDSENSLEFFALIDHWCGDRYKHNVPIESKHTDSKEYEFKQKYCPWAQTGSNKEKEWDWII